jgi:hypothetical protein
VTISVWWLVPVFALGIYIGFEVTIRVIVRMIKEGEIL